MQNAMGVAYSMGDIQQGAQTPAAMVTQLASVADVKECATISRKATSAATSALVLRCCCAGRAQEIAGHGDKATSDLAAAFDVSKKTIERWGQVYRDIVFPRIQQDGDAARFELEEQSWYLTAVAMAPKVGKPAIELLAEAEERKRGEPKLTAAKWGRELRADEGDEGSTTSEAKGFWRAVRRFAKKYDGLDLDDAVSAVDPSSVLDDTRDALVQLGDAVKALERRVKRP